MKQISLKNLALEKKCSFISDFSIDSDVLLTFINPIKRFFKGDFFRPGWKPIRWKVLIRNMRKHPKFSKDFIDLRKLFLTRKVNTEFHIHFSCYN